MCAGARALVAVWLAALASPASAQVTVTFVAPERYTDAENRFGSGSSLRVTLGELRRLFVELGSRVLQPGEALAIDVLDIDLAGFDQPGANVPYGLRVVTDATPPRFRLRYALRVRGRAVLSAEETVTDINFLTRYAGRTSSTSFAYERDVIRDWFRSRFGGRKPSNG